MNFRKLNLIENDLEKQLDELMEAYLNSPSNYLQDYRRRLYHVNSWEKTEDSYVFHTISNNEFLDINLRNMDFLDEWSIKTPAVTMSDTQKTRKLPSRFKQVLTEYQAYYRYYDNPRRETIEQEIFENLRKERYDETGRIVTDKQWEQAADLADKDRPLGESRAIVVDDSIVCINAAAAIENLPEFQEFDGKKWDKSNDPRKMGNLVYKECEKSNGVYRGHRVRYATKEEILIQMDED